MEYPKYRYRSPLQVRRLLDTGQPINYWMRVYTGAIAHDPWQRSLTALCQGLRAMIALTAYYNKELQAYRNKASKIQTLTFT